MNVRSVGKASGILHIFKPIWGHTLRRDPMNVHGVAKPLVSLTPLKYTWECTEKSNPKNVRSVGKPPSISCVRTHSGECPYECKGLWKSLHVSLKPVSPFEATHFWAALQMSAMCDDLPAFWDPRGMLGRTLSRGPMNVSNVGGPTGMLRTCKPTWGHTLGRAPANVSNVGKHRYSDKLQVHMRLHSGERPCIYQHCRHCRRPFRYPASLRTHVRSCLIQKLKFWSVGKVLFSPKDVLYLSEEIGEKPYEWKECLKIFRYTSFFLQENSGLSWNLFTVINMALLL